MGPARPAVPARGAGEHAPAHPEVLPSGRVCDIGAGPGRYALELARLGYRVSLVDLSEASLAHARRAVDAAGLAAEAFVVGDARDLSAFGDATFDAALLLGPRYHITEPRADDAR
ncbi:MAG TPA: class I SAM-dependent methyltransferase [Longimicrobiales bacterium]